MTSEATESAGAGRPRASSSRSTPPRALGISVLALAAAGLAALFRPEATERYWAHVWVLALIPPFLLSFHRGWRGAATALAAGMATLTAAEVGRGLLFATAVDWWIYGTVTVGLVVVGLGAALTTEALYRAGVSPLALRTRRGRRRELARAIRRAEFQLHYQPIVSLETGDVRAVEALVRWEHPEGNVLLPGEFLPVAESTGLIVPLGYWVLEQACAHHPVWSERLYREDELVLSLNLSAEQFRDPELPGRITEAAEDRLAVDLLQVEVPAAVLAELTEEAERLRTLGVALAVDDVGDDPALLDEIDLATVSALKVDRSFVAALGVGGRPERRLRSLVERARDLGVRVIAEGIESREQYRTLRELGCDQGQGYYICKPVPVSASTLELGFDLTVQTTRERVGADRV